MKLVKSGPLGHCVKKNDLVDTGGAPNGILMRGDDFHLVGSIIGTVPARVKVIGV